MLELLFFLWVGQKGVSKTSPKIVPILLQLTLQKQALTYGHQHKNKKGYGVH